MNTKYKKILIKQFIFIFVNLTKFRFGLGPHALRIKAVEDENKKLVEEIKKESGVKESDTGLALPSQWNLANDKMLMGEKTLSVAMCTKIIEKDTPNPKYLINMRQIAKFVVGLGKEVSKSDIEEGMRVGVERKNVSDLNIFF